MNRIDGAVAAARAGSPASRSPGKYGAVVAALMVVLNLQVVVIEQALRDDEVMRLVAAGNRRRRAPRGQSRRRRAEEAGEDAVRSAADERPTPAAQAEPATECQRDCDPDERQHAARPDRGTRRARESAATAGATSASGETARAPRRRASLSSRGRAPSGQPRAAMATCHASREGSTRDARAALRPA